MPALERATATAERPITSVSGRSGLNPLHHSGRIAGLLFVVACLSGVYLTMFFRFGFDASYAAVTSVEASFVGRVVRAVHRYSSVALIVVSVVHGWRSFVAGRFSGPRRIAWVSGIAMVAVLWVIGVTGYWLIWDERAEVLNQALFRVLGVFPAGTDFMLDFVVTGAAGTGWAFLLILFLVHVGLSLGVAGLLWLHLRHMARRRWLPRGAWVGLVLASLVLGAVVLPVGMIDPADGASLVGSVSVDPFFLFLIPWAISWNPAAVWGGAAALAVVAALVPWLTGGAASVVDVDEERCIGCSWCARDCPYGAIEMIEHPHGTHLHLAAVDAGRCVGCAICLGSCPVEALAMDGVEPRSLWSDTTAVAAAGSETITFTCARRSGGADDGSLVVPCVGSTAPALWEHAMDEGLDVGLDACGPDDCAFLEGSALAAARAAGDRPPHLRRAYATTGVAVRLDGMAADRAGTTPAPGMDDAELSLVAVLPVAAFVVAVALVSIWVSQASYDVGDGDTGAVTVALDHRPGVPLIGEPGEATVVANPAPVLRVTVDGEPQIDRVVPLVSADAPSTALAWDVVRFEPGVRTIEVSLTDGPGLETRILFDDVVAIGPGESLVLEYRDREVVVAADAGRELFESKTRDARSGCVICHSLEADRTLVGPSLAGIADVAGSRVPGLDAEAYLRQSLVEPDAYVVDGFPSGQMLPDLADTLTPAQIDQLVAFMLTLEGP